MVRLTVQQSEPRRAVRRAGARDRSRYADEQWRLHHRAADLLDRLALDDPHRVTVLDRRLLDAELLIDRMAELIGAAQTGCLPQPATVAVTPAGRSLRRQRCRLRMAPA